MFKARVPKDFGRVESFSSLSIFDKNQAISCCNDKIAQNETSSFPTKKTTHFYWHAKLKRKIDNAIFLIMQSTGKMQTTLFIQVSSSMRKLSGTLSWDYRLALVSNWNFLFIGICWVGRNCSKKQQLKLNDTPNKHNKPWMIVN